VFFSDRSRSNGPATVSKASLEGGTMGVPMFIKAQVVIPVSDIYDTTAWYERVMGFETRYIHGRGRRDETEDFANYGIMAATSR
jgi:hypothetical protein